MSEIFKALPGIEVPVVAIKKGLTQMWNDTAASGGAAPQHDAAKATQVNFVVQFGLQTTVADATEQFQIAVRFSRRYPCRVVVLCPMPDDTTETEMRAKIYGECHLGKSKGDTRCCEFNFLLNRSKRVLLDSAITPADALTFPWPKPEAVRDLAHARLLPVRQTIGQFLSAYAPAKLIEGLSGVTLVHTPAVAAEARVLAKWLTHRLSGCGATDVAVTLKENAGGASFELEFNYTNAHRFHWCGDLEHGSGKFEADYGTGKTTLPTAVSLLTPEAALGEAMFF